MCSAVLCRVGVGLCALLLLCLIVQVCNKQYQTAMELEEHLSSYDHHHKKASFVIFDRQHKKKSVVRLHVAAPFLCCTPASMTAGTVCVCVPACSQGVVCKYQQVLLHCAAGF